LGPVCGKHAENAKPLECGVEPREALRSHAVADVLTRIASHPHNRLAELLPDRWKPLA
jgi:hypothetical protein